MPFSGYRTCTACFLSHHDQCDGVAEIYHVGGRIEYVPCVCRCPDSLVDGPFIPGIDDERVEEATP